MKTARLTMLSLSLIIACKENAVQNTPNAGQNVPDDWLMKFGPEGQTTFRVQSDSTIVINVTLSDSTGSHLHSAIVKYPQWMVRWSSNGKDVGVFQGGFLPTPPEDESQPWGSGIWSSDSIWNSQSRAGYFFIYKLK